MKTPRRPSVGRHRNRTSKGKLGHVQPAESHAERSQRILDAVHREPAVQAGAAHVRRAPRTCTTRRPTAARCSTAPPASGASMPATAGRRSPRRSSSRPPSSTTRRPSRWAIPKAFELANRLVDIAPEGLDHVFFTNSGSESVDTALKIALAYQRVQGRGLAHPPDRPRARLSRRQFRRHLGRRHRRQPQDVRHAADRRRPHAAHPRPGQERLLAAASRSMARSSPTSWSASSRCTTPRPSPPSSSSRSPARPAC